MKATGIVRKVDKLGRIVLPIELRNTLEICPPVYFLRKCQGCRIHSWKKCLHQLSDRIEGALRDSLLVFCFMNESKSTACEMAGRTFFVMQDFRKSLAVGIKNLKIIHKMI